MSVYRTFLSIFKIVTVGLLICSCTPAPTPGNVPDTPPVQDPDTPPVVEPETGGVDMVGNNEGFDVQQGAFPIDRDLSVNYLNDPVVYSPLMGYIHPAVDFNTMTSEEFVDFYYESLRNANPGYISRKGIGVDDTGSYTMWCYTFTPKDYKTTVYIQAGVHGRNEFEGYYATAMMMRMITDAEKSSDPHLKYLRDNIRFIVVPVVNVFDVSRRAEIARGLATGGTYSPNNSANINLNRDWFNQVTEEVRNVKALLTEYNSEDIAFALDAHTDPEGMPGWGAYLLPYADGMPDSVTSKMHAVADFLYEKNITGKVKWNGADLYEAFQGPNTDYPISSVEWKNNRNGNYARGTITNSCGQGLWTDLGIYALTGEHGARKFGTEGSKVEMCRAVELYLNHILVQVEDTEE